MFWDHFLSDGPRTLPSRTLVVGDLSLDGRVERPEGRRRTGA